MMRTLSRFFLALAALLLGLAPATAASFEWGGTVEGRVGYGTNPFLNTRSNAGTGLVGASVSPMLRWKSATSVTELSGSYSRDQYFSRYGHADNYYVDLSRVQQLSPKLSANAQVGYFSSISGLFSPTFGGSGGGLPTYGPGYAGASGLNQPGGAAAPVTAVTPVVINNPGNFDQLALGTRQERVYGSAGLSWQPTARDTVYTSGRVERNTFKRFGGDYTYLAGSAGYMRTLDARTRAGVDLTVARTFSNTFPDSTSYQPNVTLQRTLSAHWTFNGGVGAIIQRERRLGRTRTNVSPGFNAGLCGDYPRLTMCLTASRAAAATGIGGLRRQTQVGVNATYRLSERSRILAVGAYGTSRSSDPVTINNVAYGNQRFALARLDYQRDLSRRLTAGVTGSYQTRSGGGVPDVKALAITFNLTAKFGHLS